MTGNEFPVDVWRIAREMGVTVIYGEWRGRPHGMCLYPERVIILNRRRRICQQRFDLAHELAHYVLGVEERHTDAANRWAAELLMPEAIFKMETLVRGISAELLVTFGVSKQAAELRARDLGYQG